MPMRPCYAPAPPAPRFQWGTFIGIFATFWLCVAAWTAIMLVAAYAIAPLVEHAQ